MKCTKLIFKSPVFGSVQCEDLPNEDSRSIDFGPDVACKLYEKGPEVEEFLKENREDLVEHIPEELESSVVKAVFGISDLEYGELYLLTEIYVRQELTEREQSLLHEWIVGQMSDGWGEGLEQREAYSENVRIISTFFDEEECEFDDEAVTVTADYFLHPWARDARWSLGLVDKEVVELDIEEPDTEEELRQTLLKVKELIDEIVEELKDVT